MDKKEPLVLTANCRKRGCCASLDRKVVNQTSVLRRKVSAKSPRLRQFANRWRAAIFLRDTKPKQI